MNRTNCFRFLLLIALLCMQPASAQTSYDLELLENSAGLSQILAINAHGHAIGVKEVEIPDVGFGESCFFWDGEKEFEMPMLDGYTNVRSESMSDSGHVVGYASRPIGSAGGNMEACLWHPVDGSIIGLGRLPNHRSSHAMDINGDGTLVVGYSTGRDPPTMVPCVWRLEEERWVCEALPVMHAFNPYLLTGRVAISDNGSKIAACITVDIVDRADVKRYVSSTFLWHRENNNGWQREKLTDQQLRLASINNQGRVVGSCLVEGALRAYVLDRDGKFELLELPEGDVSSAATDVNNAGVVVGYSDDPPGPEGGPTAFIWSNGRLEPLPFSVATIFSSAATINDRGDIGGYLAIHALDDQPEQTAAFLLRRNP